MDNPNRVEGLFGGPLTIELIRKTFRHMRALNAEQELMPDPPVILPAWLYDKAKAAGLELAGYVRQEKIGN